MVMSKVLKFSRCNIPTKILDYQPQCYSTNAQTYSSSPNIEKLRFYCQIELEVGLVEVAVNILQILIFFF